MLQIGSLWRLRVVEELRFGIAVGLPRSDDMNVQLSKAREFGILDSLDPRMIVFNKELQVTIAVLFGQGSYQ